MNNVTIQTFPGKNIDYNSLDLQEVTCKVSVNIKKLSVNIKKFYMRRLLKCDFGV